MLGLAERVLAIHQALDRAAILHAFGGAIACAYHAAPRATRDIDVNLFVPRVDPARALQVLADVGVTVDIDQDSERVRRDSQVRLR